MIYSRPSEECRDAFRRRPRIRGCARARRVVPGGMFGHMRASGLPAGYPQFFERGEGCHLWDVDGRRYVDFMCSWGPIILGHKHPAVTEAVQRQMAAGDCLNGPTERMVEVAERLVRSSRTRIGLSSRRMERTRRRPAQRSRARLPAGERFWPLVAHITAQFHGAHPIRSV
jgi:4-aminobutyrate aminotransferase-like enzyme